MTRRAHAHVHPHARVAAAIAAVAFGVALAGCAQSSNTTSSATTAPGGSPPTSSTPTGATTPPTTTATTPGSTPPSTAHGLSVSPTVGAPHSVIHFAVTPTYPTGDLGNNDISYALSVMGPQQPGCVGVHQQGLAALPSGQTATVSLGPAELGGNWCPGTYTARVEVLARPKCGQGQMCPQFIRVLASMGPVSFRISG